MLYGSWQRALIAKGDPAWLLHGPVKKGVKEVKKAAQNVATVVSTGNDNTARSRNNAGTVEEINYPADEQNVQGLAHQTQNRRDAATVVQQSADAGGFQSTGVGKAVEEGTEWVDRAAHRVGEWAGSQAQKVGGSSAPPSEQAKKLAQEGVTNPNTCSAGNGCGPLKRGWQILGFLGAGASIILTDRFQIELASLPDRDDVVAEVWFGANHVAELRQEEGTLRIQLYPPRDGSYWDFLLVDFFSALEKAHRVLVSPTPSK